MSDPETRDEIADVIKEACPLRTVLTKKPCPYFGASKSCLSCTYNWVAIAVDVRKLAEKRRASYEQERAKSKELTAELAERNEGTAEVRRAALNLLAWLVEDAVPELAEKLRGEEIPDEAEEEDVGFE